MKTKAKVGDTIVITHPGLITPIGEKYTVVECPSKFRGTTDDQPEYIWITDKSGHCWLTSDLYGIVEQAITTIPKPGDTILITSLDNADIWQTFVVGEVECKTLAGLMKIVCKNGSTRYLSDTGYEVIEPSSTIAKPGDTIIITDSRLESDFGKKYVVVEPACPSKPVNDVVDCVWVKVNDAFGEALFHHRSYEIIKRTNAPTLVSCPDCHDKGTIQLFTFTVKCKCCETDDNSRRQKI